jgi:hypothetical protein
MDSVDLVPETHIEAFGNAFYRRDDQLACAPLLARGGVAWESWAIVEEMPEAEREAVVHILKQLGFDDQTAATIIQAIGWYA